MKTPSRALTLFCVQMLIGQVAIPCFAAPPPGYTRKILDESFDGTSLNTAIWDAVERDQKAGDPRKDAVEVRDSKLRLKVYSNRIDGKYKHRVGYVHSRDKFAAKYGYIESHIKFETESGIGAAFWLWSKQNEPNERDAMHLAYRERTQRELYDDKDYKDLEYFGSEIDIVEALAKHRFKGEGPLLDYRKKWVFNIHWGGYQGAQSGYPQQSVKTVHLDVPGGRDLIGEWHTFGLLWTPNTYSFYLDDRKMWDTVQGVSRHDQYLILSTAAGGLNDFMGPPPNDGFGSPKTRMTVDWVRWWQE